MTQITAPHDVVHDLDGLTAHDDDAAREGLRSTVPAAIAVVLLFGALIAGALALRSLLEFGVLLLSA